MGEYVHARGQVVQVRRADGAAVHRGFKAVLRAEGQGLVQRGSGAGAEGRARLRLAPHALHCDEPGYIAYHILLMGVHPLRDAFLHCHAINSFVYFSASEMILSALSPTWNSPFS